MEDMDKTSKSLAKFLRNKENIVTILSDALYNSSWFCAHTPKSMAFHTENAKREGIDTDSWCREEKWAYILMNGGHIVIEDMEEEKVHDLDLSKLNKAWKKLIEKYPRMYANIVLHEGDFYDADGLIQIAVFNDIIYG